MSGEVTERRRRRRSRVSRHHQITVPAAILDAAHIGPGDEVDFATDGDGRIVVTRFRDPLEDLIGSAPGLSAATDLESLRDEWER
ncbi:MAG TPA: AbrB/MazE/SpoVT family DNA-binding domain-containing protein [Mycobacteriales bacterium]|nr:AbrB/MazE/SpoVT family DNA-binding domain-containing protein [Mycobacteriales bacterium]